MPRKSSRDLILDTAEAMFAERGVEGFSLREINEAAGLSSAAIHYHFKTKENLLKAILNRRVLPLEQWHAPLRKIYRSKNPPDLREVMRALVMPMTTVLLEQGEGGRNYVKLIARLLSDHHHNVELPEVFVEGITMVAALIPRALPQLPPAVAKMRHAVTVETVVNSLANSDYLTALWALGKPVPKVQHQQFADWLIDYICGGLSAPVS